MAALEEAGLGAEIGVYEYWEQEHRKNELAEQRRARRVPPTWTVTTVSHQCGITSTFDSDDNSKPSLPGP
jgi:hypothetical protein